MFKTRITELFGIEHPIVGGCMMHISGPEFVAAISNGGALGMMASAMYPSQDEFRQAVRQVRSLTDRPFGVNLSLFPALRPIDNDLYVEVILEEEVPVVETSGHRPPEEMLARLKEAGVKTMHKCVSVRHAQSAQKAGVDAVTVFGSEGGGHIGELGLSTMYRCWRPGASPMAAGSWLRWLWAPQGSPSARVCCSPKNVLFIGISRRRW
jgi:NAD(P)H-dependent flavin oxidoreductase YrpB (nitropropane dioxygenase family)